MRSRQSRYSSFQVVSGPRIHDIRHSFAVRALEASQSIALMREIRRKRLSKHSPQRDEYGAVVATNLLSADHVAIESLPGRVVQRHKSALAKLSVSDDHAIACDVVDLKCQCLRDPNSCAYQKRYQGHIGCRAKRAFRCELRSRAEQAPELIRGIYVRPAAVSIRFAERVYRPRATRRRTPQGTSGRSHLIAHQQEQPSNRRSSWLPPV